MIKLIYKTIWNEKRSNLWILIELILIFVIFFFCVDFTYKKTKLFIEPLGFNIEHTYNVSLKQKSYGEALDKEQCFAIYQQMIDNIKTHPFIENVCISTAAIPYDDSFINNLLFVDNTDTYPQIKHVSTAFFDVFKINLIEGQNFSSNDIIKNNVIILGGNSNSMFYNIPMTKINLVTSNDKEEKKVIGFANPVKRSEFNDYSPIAYFPFNQNSINKWGTVISFRVKEEADKKENIAILKKYFTSVLSVDPFYFIDIISSKENKDEYMYSTNYSNDIKNIGSISMFLLANIFLGVIGTFWLRIQFRKSQIGLQMAMGASRKKIKLLYILESLFILLISSFIGFIIIANILATNIIDSIGFTVVSSQPIISSQSLKELNEIQLLIDYLITFGILAIISLIAVWIPVSKATRLAPAYILRSE